MRLAQRTLAFIVNIEPVAQMRARATAIDGHARAYKASKQKRREEQLMVLLDKHCPPSPLTTPLNLIIIIHLPIPQSKPAWWKECAKKREIYPAKRPDIDNYIKHIVDCMQAVGFFHDDAQIVEIYSVKVYSEKPRWEIRIEEYNEIKSKAEAESYRKGALTTGEQNVNE